MTDETKPSPFVLLGTVLPDCKPFDFYDNMNSVFRGQVRCSDGETRLCFIKDISEREFANELFAAALAKEVGVPVPLPIIARAAPDSLQATQIKLSGTDDFVVFASAAVPASPVLQVLRDAGPLHPEVMKRIACWIELGTLYGFDAWTANIDRHRGNLLLGGESSIWAIDHGQAFSGPNWSVASLDASYDYRNRLSEWLTPSLTGHRRSELLGTAKEIGGELTKSDLVRIGTDNWAKSMLGVDFDAIVSFLEQRAVHVPRLSTSALGMLM